MALWTPDTLSPSALSLPAKFPSYRPAQLEMAEFALYGAAGYDPEAAYLDFEDEQDPRRRFVCIGAPGGIGKTLAAQTIGKLSGVKYGVLTATRALEDQIVADGFDTANVRGKDNYTCQQFDPLHPERRWSCKEGEEAEEGETEYCSFACKSGCTYGSAALSAKLSPSFVTNYAYWLYARGSNRRALETPGQPVKILICDEAHLAPEQVSSYCSCWVGQEDFKAFGGAEAQELLRKAHRKSDPWAKVDQPWLLALVAAGDAAMNVLVKAESSRDRPLAKRVKRFVEACMRVVDLSSDGNGGNDGNWIWQLTKTGVQFDCVWPRKYAKRYLFQDVARIILISATLRPKCMSLLGLGREEYDFREWPRQFPAHLAPVVWWPTVRLSDESPKAEKLKSVARADQIIQGYIKHKGIVHTPSYALAEFFQANSRYGRHMILNPRGKNEAQRAAQKFREAEAPAILVSPSYGAGWDFPAEQCEWQFIPKLPFPDQTSPLSQAREEDDQYALYQTAQTLQQQCMRVQRSFTDRGVTIIGDDNIKWFQYAARPFFTRWFKIRQVAALPTMPHNR